MSELLFYVIEYQPQFNHYRIIKIYNENGDAMSYTVTKTIADKWLKNARWSENGKYLFLSKVSR